jgi:hypothetical protein
MQKVAGDNRRLLLREDEMSSVYKWRGNSSAHCELYIGKAKTARGINANGFSDSEGHERSSRTFTAL